MPHIPKSCQRPGTYIPQPATTSEQNLKPLFYDKVDCTIVVKDPGKVLLYVVVRSLKYFRSANMYHTSIPGLHNYGYSTRVSILFHRLWFGTFLS